MMDSDSNISSSADIFGKGTNDSIGKSDSMIGRSDFMIGKDGQKSGPLGNKIGTGRDSLNSIYAQAQRRIAARNLREKATDLSARAAVMGKDSASPERGALSGVASLGAKKSIQETIKIMEKRKAFDPFLSKSMQTAENKLMLAKSILEQAEGRKITPGAFTHRNKLIEAGNNILAKGTGIKKRDCSTEMAARKAIAGTLGDLTESKNLQRRANRT